MGMWRSRHGGEKPKAKLFAEVIKDGASAARAEAEQPDVFAGFDEEMGARNAGKEQRMWSFRLIGKHSTR